MYLLRCTSSEAFEKIGAGQWLSTNRQRLLQTLAALFYLSVFMLLPVILLVLYIWMLFDDTWRWFGVVYTLWLVYDWNSPKRGSHPVAAYRTLVLWRYMRDYFPIRLIKTVDLDPNRNYVFGVHPHGIFSISAFVNFATDANGFSTLFPGLTPRLCTLVGQFWWPFRRELGTMSGAIDCSKEGIQWALTRPQTGQAVMIVVGGGHEMMNAHPGTYDLVLKSRRGFIRIALRHGADLVPVLSFGENDLYDQYANPPGSTLRYWQEVFKKACGFPLPILSGQGFWNEKYGIMPKRVPVNTVVGKPICVRQIMDPDESAVNELYERYVEALTNLFETEKKKYSITQEVKLNIT